MNSTILGKAAKSNSVYIIFHLQGSAGCKHLLHPHSYNTLSYIHILYSVSSDNAKPIGMLEEKYNLVFPAVVFFHSIPGQLCESREFD